MTLDEARAARNRVQRSLEPDTLPNLKVADLQELYDCLCGARSDLLGFGFPISEIDEFLRILRQEMGAKLAEERGERHHTQVMAQGSDILVWTKRAVLAAVVVPILVALIAEIPFSGLLRAKASPASPTSSEQKQASAAPTITPTAAEPASTQSPVSPTPEEASTPVQTPIKFPPPAP